MWKLRVFLTFRPFFCKQIDNNIAQRRFKEHRHADVPILARKARACVLHPPSSMFLL